MLETDYTMGENIRKIEYHPKAIRGPFTKLIERNVPVVWDEIRESFRDVWDPVLKDDGTVILLLCFVSFSIG